MKMKMLFVMGIYLKAVNPLRLSYFKAFIIILHSTALVCYAILKYYAVFLSCFQDLSVTFLTLWNVLLQGAEDAFFSGFL